MMTYVPSSVLHECYGKRTDCAFEGKELAAHLYFNTDKKSAEEKELNEAVGFIVSRKKDVKTYTLHAV